MGGADLTAYIRAYICVLTAVHAEGKKGRGVNPRPRHHALAHTYTHIAQESICAATDILANARTHTQTHTRLAFRRAQKSLSRLTGGVIEEC